MECGDCPVFSQENITSLQDLHQSHRLLMKCIDLVNRCLGNLFLLLYRTGRKYGFIGRSRHRVCLQIPWYWALCSSFTAWEVWNPISLSDLQSPCRDADNNGHIGTTSSISVLWGYNWRYSVQKGTWMITFSYFHNLEKPLVSLGCVKSSDWTKVSASDRLPTTKLLHAPIPRQSHMHRPCTRSILLDVDKSLAARVYRRWMHLEKIGKE